MALTVLCRVGWHRWRILAVAHPRWVVVPTNAYGHSHWEAKLTEGCARCATTRTRVGGLPRRVRT